MRQGSFDFTPADLEARVLERLLPGRCNARHTKDIAAELGVSDRRVRNAVNRLIMENGVLIGSAVNAPSGTFLAVTQEEIRDASKELYRRALSILARSAKLRRESLRMVFIQACLALDVDPDEADIRAVMQKIKQEEPYVADENRTA